MSRKEKQSGKFEINNRHQTEHSPHAKPLFGAQQSSSERSQTTSRSDVSNLDSPCRRVANLKINSTKKTKAKLFVSKSLSLMPKKFFSNKGDALKIKESRACKKSTLVTSKSFPNRCFQMDYAPELPNVQSSQTVDQDSLVDCSLSDGPGSPVILNNRRVIDSVSMIGLHRQSTNASLNHQSNDVYCLADTNQLSPIALNEFASVQNQMIKNVVASTPTLRMRCPKLIDNERNKEKGRDTINEGKLQGENGIEQDANKKQESKTKLKNYKPFKTTALVLRDVGNSIGLRLKAKQERKAFAKLTNEIATPPTKLYSPFNIYSANCSISSETTTPTSRTKETKSFGKSKSSKRRERVNRLALDHSLTVPSDSGYECSMGMQTTPSTTASTLASNVAVSDKLEAMTAHDKAPKNRIALRHKKHLMQTNAFASFDSPTGRLRETVRDVEQFQRCIEDISAAVRARGQQLI